MAAPFRRWRLRACASVILALPACSAPIHQFDLNGQAMTCEQTNANVYETLQAMGFIVSTFDRATIGHRGTLRGTRDVAGAAHNVTVKIQCTAVAAADIDASEDGRILNQLEFKRGFYMAFTAVTSQGASNAAAAQEEADRPLDKKRAKGLLVLLSPVRGLGAKLDFDLDLAAGNVLPVLLTINNVTTRTYTVDLADVVLVQADGTRVAALSVTEAAQRVATAARQQATDKNAAPPDSATIQRRLESHLLSTRSVGTNQKVKGYLYFPLAAYVKGRVVLEDKESEESEGFVVEF